MKRFLVKIFLFLLPLFCIAIIMELSLRHIPNDYRFKKQYLEQHAGEIETLVLGSSHAYYGIDPAFFLKPCFNVAQVSQTLEYDLEIVKLYEARFSNLKTVILPISYFTLFDKLGTGAEAWRIKNYVIYWDIDLSPSLNNHFEILSNNLEVNVRRLYSYYLLGNANMTTSPLGWGTTYHAANALDLDETGSTAAIRHTAKNHDNLAYNIDLLTNIIRLFDKKGVKIILFTPPAYRSYKQHLDKQQLNLMVEKVEELAKTFPNCHYINLLDDTTFTGEDFYDGDHLDEIGAKKLSLYLDDLINGKISPTGG